MLFSPFLVSFYLCAHFFREWAAKVDAKKKKKEKAEEEEEESETSQFHGTELYDYQGRSYVSCPSHVKPKVVCFSVRSPI